MALLFQASMKESTLFAGKVESLSKGINDFQIMLLCSKRMLQTVQLPEH